MFTNKYELTVHDLNILVLAGIHYQKFKGETSNKEISEDDLKTMQILCHDLQKFSESMYVPQIISKFRDLLN